MNRRRRNRTDSINAEIWMGHSKSTVPSRKERCSCWMILSIPGGRWSSRRCSDKLAAVQSGLLLWLRRAREAEMQLDSQAQAVLLLTLSFGKSGNAGAKPLSRKSGRDLQWLRDHDLKPSSLLESALDDLLSDWIDRAITLPRLESLLGRGALLGLLLEKWQRAGLWVIARSDPDYPDRLKRRLKFEAPPILFGCGSKMLLKKGGIAVVGSRNATEEDIAYTNNLGAEAAAQGYSIVSGGARGVDQSAMLGALEHEGTAVGVLADSLLRSATSAKYRKYLMAGDLALVSPFNPEAGFNVGNAMARNRFIYCLADTAVVISSTPNKGGTWNGASKTWKRGGCRSG